MVPWVLNPTSFVTLILPDLHIEDYLSLDLAPLIFNLVTCMRAHFKGIVSGYPYVIYKYVYIDDLTTTGVL